MEEPSLFLCIERDRFVQQGSCEKRKRWRLCCHFTMGGGIGSSSSVWASKFEYDSLPKEQAVPSKELLQAGANQGAGDQAPRRRRGRGRARLPGSAVSEARRCRPGDSVRTMVARGRFLDGAQLLAERENGWYLKRTEGSGRARSPRGHPPCRLPARAVPALAQRWFSGAEPTPRGL